MVCGAVDWFELVLFVVLLFFLCYTFLSFPECMANGF